MLSKHNMLSHLGKGVYATDHGNIRSANQACYMAFSVVEHSLCQQLPASCLHATMTLQNVIHASQNLHICSDFWMCEEVPMCTKIHQDVECAGD